MSQVFETITLWCLRAMVVLLFFVAMLFACTVNGQPLPRIDVNTGCVQTMSTQPVLVVYSGTQAATVFQYGFHAMDAIAGFSYNRNGKGKSGPYVCSSPILFAGDCWQSATRLAASPNVPKWIVWTGAPDMCTTQGLAVAKWNPAISRYQWWGFINGSINRLGQPKLDGDFAYAPEQPPSTTYMKFDLEAKTVVAGNLPNPTTPPVQANIQGYTYTIHAIHPNPIPPQYPGPNLFYWQRHGSITPQPTETPIWTPSPSRTPTARCPTEVPTNTPVPSTPVPATPTAVGTIGPAPTKTPTPHLGPAPTKTNTPQIGPRTITSQTQPIGN